MSIKVVCLMGPTASGKTDWSLRLADRLPCEIISVDSAMVYKGMDIGTAKPSAEIRSQVRHHLIDILGPAMPYSAAKFVTDSQRLILDIHRRGKIPLLVGGTMLYFKTLQSGISPLPSADANIRQQLTAEAEIKGWAQMHARLSVVDPLSGARINPNDPQRIQRALEVYYLTGQPLSVLWQSQEKLNLPFRWINLALVPDDRAILHKRIKVRFEEMLSCGLIEEVETLRSMPDLHPDLPSMRCVGYRQVWQYLDSRVSYDEMAQNAIVATRQLAKRQLTWLRQWDSAYWFKSLDSTSLSDLMNYVKSELDLPL